RNIGIPWARACWLRADSDGRVLGGGNQEPFQLAARSTDRKRIRILRVVRRAHVLADALGVSLPGGSAWSRVRFCAARPRSTPVDHVGRVECEATSAGAVGGLALVRGDT